eukprot:8201929-Pyramimonas_sp.AAC.1
MKVVAALCATYPAYPWSSPSATGRARATSPRQCGTLQNQLNAPAPRRRWPRRARWTHGRNALPTP